MRIAVCQLNYKIGDLTGNIAKIKDAVKTAAAQKADLAVCSELSVWGYPVGDYLLYPYLINKANQLIQQLAFEIREYCPLIVGAPVIETSGYHLPYFNAGLLLQNGNARTITTKKYLPYYDIFDEPRYFASGMGPASFFIGGKEIILSVCEDMWQSKEFNILTTEKITCEGFDTAGADLIINISASPFFGGKIKLRDVFLKKFAAQFRKKLLFVNQTGAHDHIIFDGSSRFISEHGDIISKLASFQEEIQIIDTENTVPVSDGSNVIDLKPLVTGQNMKELHQALVYGLKEYCLKNNVAKVCVGVSGGIDSAVVLCLAAEALGKENVYAVTMPSEYNSAETKSDADTLIKNLAVMHYEIPIDTLKNTYNKELDRIFDRHTSERTKENIQSRVRGTLIMAIANQLGALVLSTGNKSELLTGYCTIYGDTNGALAVIGDMWKTHVFMLAEYINKKAPVIPVSVISREPSAELKPNQADSDTLPPYALLDEILEKITHDFKAPEELIREGYEMSVVRKVVKLIHDSEFKRKQLPPVIKISPRSLTGGWRMPVSSVSI